MQVVFLNNPRAPARNLFLELGRPDTLWYLSSSDECRRAIDAVVEGSVMGSVGIILPVAAFGPKVALDLVQYAQAVKYPGFVIVLVPELTQETQMPFLHRGASLVLAETVSGDDLESLIHTRQLTTVKNGIEFERDGITVSMTFGSRVVYVDGKFTPLSEQSAVLFQALARKQNMIVSVTDLQTLLGHVPNSCSIYSSIRVLKNRLGRARVFVERVPKGYVLRTSA